MRLLFVRHGESTWNLEGRFQGQLDPLLSDLGVLQAKAVAERIAREDKPAAIISSPLIRARRTAELIAHACELPLVTDDRLCEISHGQWEGLLGTEVAKRWPAMLAQWREAPEAVHFPEGESLADVEARLASFLAEVEGGLSPMVVCTHDVIVRLAVLWAEGNHLDRFWDMKTENASITEIDLEGHRRTLVRRNDAAHLDGLRSDLARQAL
jgi:broad specificity phosphatase PhoE